jgi:hypothetical protein
MHGGEGSSSGLTIRQIYNVMQKETDFIFGLRPVIEAISAGRQIDRLLVRDGLQGSLYHELMRESFEVCPRLEE